MLNNFGRKNTFGKNTGIAALALVIIIVAIIVAAGAGGYLYYSSLTSSTAPSSNTTRTAASTTPTPQTTAGTTTPTTGTTSTGLNFLSAVNTVQDLLGNFTQLKGTFNSSGNFGGTSSTENGTLSYQIVNTVTNSSGLWREVNYSSSITSSGTTSSTFYLVYYNPSYVATVVTLDGNNFTGSEAQLFGQDAVLEYSLVFAWESAFFNQQYFNQLSYVGTSTQTFGSVTMSVASYTASALTNGGETVNNLKISSGQISGKNFALVTYLSGSFSGSNGSGSFTYALVSATLA